MRILIVKTSSFGDIVHCFPVIDYLRQKIPQAIIDWVVEKPCAELVEAHPEIDKVIKISTKEWRRGRRWSDIPKAVREIREKEYDIVFDLQGNSKSGLFTLMARSRYKIGFGWASVAERPNLLCTHYRFDPPKDLNVRHEYLYIVQSYFQDFSFPNKNEVALQIGNDKRTEIDALLKQSGPQRKVLVCPGSAWPNKRISSNVLQEFLQLVQSDLKCTFLLIYGNENEKNEVEALQANMPSHCQIIPKLPLPALQYLMGRVDLIIAMDSLPLHLGGTTAAPTFSIFGPSASHKYQPLGDRHLSLQGPCPYDKVFEKRCPALRTCTTGACIKNYSAQELYQAFAARLMD